MVRSLSATLIFTTLDMLPVRADQTDAKLDDLLRQLQSAHELEQSQFIDSRIWDIWHRHTDRQVDKTMAIGMLNMQQGALRKSLATDNKVVLIATHFAEG